MNTDNLKELTPNDSIFAEEKTVTFYISSSVPIKAIMVIHVLHITDCERLPVEDRERGVYRKISLNNCVGVF